MTFLDPSLLQLGVGLTALVLVGLWSHAGRRRRLADFLGGRRAVDRLSRSDLYRLRSERALLLGLGGLAVAVSAAEPRWRESVDPGPQVKEVILALDVSASMQATDVSPTRLARAVDVAGELLTALEDHEVGLLLFAGTAYPLAPPTHDHDALRFLLGGLTPTIASAHDPGTLVSVGIEEGMALLERQGLVADVEEEVPADDAHTTPTPRGERLIVLIGDGETGEDDETLSSAIEMAQEAGVGLHAIGVGTDEGAGMIMPSGTYQLGGPVVDASRARATSRLQEALLQEVADAGDGQYAHADSDGPFRALQAELRDPDISPEPSAADAGPAWARYDVPFVLGLLALALVLTESLLDMRLPRLRSVRPAGEWA